MASSSQIIVTLRNDGNQAINDTFWVDVYFNPSQTPTVNRPWDTIAPAGAVWGVTKSLAQGETLVLTSGGAYYDASGSSLTFPVGAQVYVYVDSVNHNTDYGNVQERNEGNNLPGPVMSTMDLTGPVISSGIRVLVEKLPER